MEKRERADKRWIVSSMLAQCSKFLWNILHENIICCPLLCFMTLLFTSLPNPPFMFLEQEMCLIRYLYLCCRQNVFLTNSPKENTGIDHV